MAERLLSASGTELLESLPYFVQEDPQVQGLVDAVSREIARVEELIDEQRAQWFPQQLTLSEYVELWEFNLGLPVATPGLTVAQRAALVTSHLRKRKAASGADWIATLDSAFGPGSWSYKENVTPYMVRLTIPYGSGTLTTLGVLALAREVTPAHLDLTVTYSSGGAGGFIIGTSLIGVGQI